jgi:hypothetical protein
MGMAGGVVKTKIDGKALVIHPLKYDRVNDLRQTLCVAPHPVCKCKIKLSFSGGWVRVLFS